MAAVANIDDFRLGETWRILLTAHDSCNEVLSLVGAQVQWRLALNSVVLVTLEVGDGINLVGTGSTGQAVITLTPADQDELELVATVYQHECQVVLPDGTKSDQFAGNIFALSSLFPPP